MAFTVKYLQRQSVDSLKELLSDDDAELTDSERENINAVISEKETPEPDPDPKPDPKPDPAPDPKPDPKPDPAPDAPPAGKRSLAGRFYGN